MRKMSDSSKTLCSVAFSARADARSRPNGFSRTTRAPRAQPLSPSAAHDDREQARRDGEVVQRMLARRRALRAAGRTSPGPRSRPRRSAAARPACAKAAAIDAAAVLLEAVVRALRAAARATAASGDADDGTSRWPRRIIACSAGKIFLNARSPVAPKNTSASDRGARSSRSASRRGRRTRSASPTAAGSGSRPRRAS